MTKKILVVLTSAGSFRNGMPTGWYLPEFAHPHEVLESKGCTFVVASPKGGEAPLDRGSVEAFAEDPVSVAFLKNHESLYKSTIPLPSLNPADAAAEFDALYYPGGHGPMFDLANDKDSAALIEEFHKLNKPIAAVCHGSVVLTNDNFSSPLLAGHRVTGFPDAEEEQLGLVQEMPFSLEQKLQLLSNGLYEKAPEMWGEKVVVDRNIITGQNPNSGKGVGEAIAQALGI